MTVTVPTGVPADDVVDVVSTLIRFDTTNTGEPETTKGEAECARWVADQLDQAGYRVEYVESDAPGAAMCSPGWRGRTAHAVRC
ncbi:peptidase domain protein [Mycobacterium xenopi 4042]|uniref:Peptidase domain protein n=1 Tax=Mycobacterium xenopi 4042 TaxID=1299334 RepID=X8BF01_MYCXE|nr:peptidase domain protein [Mycobacterium xenopi 4042]